MANSFYVPKRAMVIVAHPDDIEFGCAGTAARWVQEGAEVCFVLVTSGDVGIARSDITRAEAAASARGGAIGGRCGLGRA